MNTRKEVGKIAVEQKEQGERLTRVEKRLETMDGRLGTMEGRLERMEDMVTAIYQAVRKPSGN